jgi:hypothetical protein
MRFLVRTRDKIAASKRKGIWVGGPVPLGYRVADKKVIVVAEEAAAVRTIFTRYLELGSIGALIEDLGAFHEFLVSMPAMPYDGFRMGRIEVTFGQATPLAAYLFDENYRWKYFGPWSGIHSARIMGANDLQEAELAFSNALIRYNKTHSDVPTLSAMNLEDHLFKSLDEEPKHESEVLVDGPVIRDVEPIRFLHRGLLQADAVAACVYFYRVLEFYAFSSMTGEFAKVRHDSTVNDETFPTEVLKLISRDEKGPLLRLVNQLASSALLKDAVRAGLIDRDNAPLLGERLYAFRNSIVHGKNTYGHDLHSPPLFEELTTPWAWRKVLRALAQTAIERFGRKLL